jgi:hypothetical protein
MRKCIDLEDQPGFEQIQSPVLMQAIDRGLQGFSGTGVIDWGHIPPVPKTKPGRKAKGKAVPLPPTPPVDPKVVNPVKLGDEKHHRYFEYLFNTFATPEARAIINKYPKPELVPWNGGGYFQPSEGKYGAVYTPMGLDNDISTLFHEYGHALDHIIGLELHKSNSALATSKMFWNEMIADGEKMGMIVNDSIYWDYITENGIDFKITTRRDFHVTKGKTRQDIERNMNPGDHWRIMEYLLKKVKTDLQNIKNTKNPDPAKVKKAEATKKSMEKLYDLYMKRIEVAKKIRKLVMESKIGKANRDRTAEGGIYRQRGAIGDILDALTAGELYDYQVATGIKFMLGGHGPGYYNTRKDSEGGHHWSLEIADMFRRAEVWAQLHQFLAHQDNTSWNIMKNLMPNTVKKFDALMKEASAGNLAANQLREIGTQQIRANPRMQSDSRMDLWKPELAGGWQTDTAPQHADFNSNSDVGIEYRESTSGEVLEELSKTDSEFGLITRLLRRKYSVPHDIKMRKYKLSDGRNYFEMPSGQRWVVTGISVNSNEVPYNVKYDRWGYASAIRNNKTDGKIVFDNFFEMMVSMGEDPRGPASLYNDRLSDEQIEKLDEEWYEKEGQEFASY